MSGLCAACGQPGHRYGRNEGMDRFDPQACINVLIGEIERLRDTPPTINPDLVDLYLDNQHATLWSRAYDLTDPRSRREARQHILNIVAGVMGVGE